MALRTREYWNEFYKQELALKAEGVDDGENWFTRSIPPVLDAVHGLWKKKSDEGNGSDHSVLDVGCGNGLFLAQLYRRGVKPIYGVDYSEEAIAMASMNTKDCEGVKLVAVSDLTKPKDGEHWVPLEGFDIVTDKGTLDVFVLNGNTEEYVRSIGRFLNRNSSIVVTSCNLANEELQNVFLNGKTILRDETTANFSVIDVVKHKEFSFGGVSGQVVSTVVFQVV